MTISQYKKLKVGDKVKLLVPMESNSGSQKHPIGTILEVSHQTPRVRQSKGMPWFFWNCIIPGTANEYPYPLCTGITNPEAIELFS